MNRRRILVVAGSDSSGGAGLEADQKVIAAHGCYAMTATTALTVQDTSGVYAVHEIPSLFVAQQINACMDDVGADIVKTGMLATTDTVSTVAKVIRDRQVSQSVIDPVMVSTSGHHLLPKEAVQVLREELLPVTMILTPNIPEALVILDNNGTPCEAPKRLQDLREIASKIQKLGPKYVLLKGGHLPFEYDGESQDKPTRRVVIDVLATNDQNKMLVFESDYIASKNTHGTGCSLASAIASRLALGHDIYNAIHGARDYIEAGIKTSNYLGKGNGPLNHFHSSYILPFAPDRFVDFLKEHHKIRDLWHDHTNHSFVKQLAKGTLPVVAFKYYMIQDYLYLNQYARASALAAYKAPSMSDCAVSASIVADIQKEMTLHLSYCKEFGLSQEDLQSQQEDQACTAYTRYVLDVGMQQDWFALQVALAPCLLGYGEIANNILMDESSVTKEHGNKYWRWVETYTGEDFQAAFRKGAELLEVHAKYLSVKRVDKIIEIFAHATKMEIGFWNMALAQINEAQSTPSDGHHNSTVKDV